MSHIKQILATTAGVAVLAAGELAIAPFASAETPISKPKPPPKHGRWRKRIGNVRKAAEGSSTDWSSVAARIVRGLLVAA